VILHKESFFKNKYRNLPFLRAVVCIDVVQLIFDWKISFIYFSSWSTEEYEEFVATHINVFSAPMRNGRFWLLRSELDGLENDMANWMVSKTSLRTGRFRKRKSELDAYSL